MTDEETRTDEVETPQEPLQEPLSDEERKEVEETLLYPDLQSMEVPFWGGTVTVRPLPIAFARQMKQIMRPLHKVIAGSVIAGNLEGEEIPEGIGEALDEDTVVELDEQVTDVLVRAAEAICKGFYKVRDGLSSEEYRAKMLEEVSMGEILNLMNAQLRVQGRSDFLLTGLRVTMKLLEISRELQERFQRLRASEVIVRLGASDLKNLLGRTQTDS